jgi:bifunctional DNase/RNase
MTDVDPGLEPGALSEPEAAPAPEPEPEPEAEPEAEPQAEADAQAPAQDSCEAPADAPSEAPSEAPPDAASEAPVEAAAPALPDSEAAAQPPAEPDPEAETPSDAWEAPTEPFMSLGATFRVMDVDDVALELPAQFPAVTLVESEPPNRVLVFPVGLTEGTAMASALRRMEGRRPMTHELFMHVLQRARIDVIAVRLTGREEGNLLAQLDLMTPSGRERVNCRPSDGLILALRMPVSSPILVDERLLETVGDVVPIDDGGGA